MAYKEIISEVYILSKYKILKHTSMIDAIGLDKEQNFLQPPICECCGEKGALLLRTDEELYSFITEMAFEWDCPNAGIFAIKNNGDLIWSSKYFNEDEDDFTVDIYFMENIGTDYQIIKELYDDCGICCYGIIFEVDDGQWQVIE